MNIKIYPDAAIAGILRRAPRENGKSKAIILLGTNGVSIDGAAVHSMGYLTVAEVAKAEKALLYIIADTMKVGRVAGSEGQRPGGWGLTNDQDALDWLNREGIELSNPKEDIVDNRYITGGIVIVDNDDETSTEVLKERRNDLSELEMALFRSFVDQLEKMIIAEQFQVQYSRDDKLADEAVKKDKFFWYAAEGYLVTDRGHNPKGVDQTAYEQFVAALDGRTININQKAMDKAKNEIPDKCRDLLMSYPNDRTADVPGSDDSK